MKRWLRIVKHRWAIFRGQQDLVFKEPKLGLEHLPSEYISSKIMDNELLIYNAGYSKKYKGYLVVVAPIPKNSNN